MRSQNIPRLPTTGLVGHLGNPYHASDALIGAANAAILLQMPLLLTGEPGCGKTEFAHVISRALQLRLEECHVRSDTRSRDLIYSFDALRRFGDAQNGSPADREAARNSANYVQLNGLGWALTAPEPCVVLIDEIDKAPRDLPNDLLCELDHERGFFEIPELAYDAPPLSHTRSDGAGTVFIQRKMRRPNDSPMPIVVITSNSERQLPDAFLRRCVFFHIDFPEHHQLLRILADRHPDPPTGLISLVVDAFLRVRAEDLSKPPSTSELINWCDAVLHTNDHRALEDVLLRFTKLEASRTLLLPCISCLIKIRHDLQSWHQRLA